MQWDGTGAEGWAEECNGEESLGRDSSAARRRREGECRVGRGDRGAGPSGAGGGSGKKVRIAPDCGAVEGAKFGGRGQNEGETGEKMAGW